MSSAVEPIADEINPRMIHEMADHEHITISLSVEEWRILATLPTRLSTEVAEGDSARE